MRPPTPQILDFGGRFWILGILDLGDFGFGILDFGDFGFWILDLGDFGFWILGILDFGFWGRNPKSKIPQSKIQNPNFFGRFWGFWILDFGQLCSKSLCGPKFGGFWILDFRDFGFWGFWILDFGPLCSKSLCEAPNAPNLGDFGDFGFWILGILDFGVWGFWILDFVTNFGFYIRRRRLCTPTRLGGLV